MPRPHPFALHTLSAMALFPALLPAAAQADELMLRIRQTQANGNTSYQLTHATHGDFQVQPPLPDPREGDLVIVGRDAQGRELFRRAVRNPGAHRAEVFDPQTGRIAVAKTIQRSGGVVEVHVPHLPALDSIDLLERPASDATNTLAAKTDTAGPTPVKRVLRQELDSVLQGNGKQRAEATLSASLSTPAARPGCGKAAPATAAWTWCWWATDTPPPSPGNGRPMRARWPTVSWPTRCSPRTRPV